MVEIVRKQFIQEMDKLRVILESRPDKSAEFSWATNIGYLVVGNSKKWRPIHLDSYVVDDYLLLQKCLIRGDVLRGERIYAGAYVIR
jgi:hypothetical protein